MNKSERYTSKYLNKGKHIILEAADAEALSLKNEMSRYCFSNLFLLLSDSHFANNYKIFGSKYLSAWEVQAIFKDVICFYKIQFSIHVKNLCFKIQKGYTITYYKRKSGKYKKGDIKNFKINLIMGGVGKLLKYLCFSNNGVKINNSELQIIYDYIKENGMECRLLSLVSAIQSRIRKSMKLIVFTTGTHRKLYGMHKDNNGDLIQENGFVVDNTNSHYKVWFRHKTRNKVIYVPVQINEKYHHLDKIEKSQFFVKKNGKSFDFIGIKEVDNPDFKDFHRAVGIDLNVKNNFMVTSDGITFDYDREYIQEFTKELKKLDKIGLKNISEQQKKHLNKLVKKNEWYFKKLIHDILEQLEKEGITDIVMEDLDKFSKTFIKSEEFEIKYSRLVRLLRLSNIKNWLNSQAEKKGIKVHVTSPCYTSQMCPKCGHIHHDNRKSQEEFICLKCGYSDNADINAANNILRRFTSDVLNENLHNKDCFGRLQPKKLKKRKIKQILQEY